MKCRKETESEEKRCTLLQYPVKLGTRSAESCTKVFVILWRVVPLNIVKITSRPCGVISSDPLADCREFTGTRGQWGHPLFSSHTHACTYKGRISGVIYSLTVHTYRYFLFGETFESDEDGAFGYSPCRAFFFRSSSRT